MNLCASYRCDQDLIVQASFVRRVANVVAQDKNVLVFSDILILFKQSYGFLHPFANRGSRKISLAYTRRVD